MELELEIFFIKLVILLGRDLTVQWITFFNDLIWFVNFRSNCFWNLMWIPRCIRPPIFLLFEWWGLLCLRNDVLFDNIVHLLFYLLYLLVMFCYHFIICRTYTVRHQEILHQARNEWKTCKKTHDFRKALKKWFQLYHSRR